MEKHGLDSIRNLVFLSHNGAGKTSLSEAIMFAAKAITRQGKVEDGTTTSDYDPEEHKRSMSINLSLLPCEWKGTKINIIDTPGYADFIADIKAGIRVSEGAIIVVCAASGVEVGTEQVWTYCEEAELSRFIYVNKMDRENADFFRTLEGLQSKFGSKCVPLQLPIGAHNTFEGIVDILDLKSYTGSSSAEGGEIPSSLQDQVDSFKEKLIEAVAEIDDNLLEKYLGGEELSQEELINGLKKSVLTGKIVPVLVGSAVQSIGVNQLLDSVNSYLPSPKDQGVELIGDSGEQTVEPNQDAPLAALVFKTTADPYVGKLTYFRVYNGVIESNSQVWNSGKNETERIGQLFTIKGKTQEPVPEIRAGDIGAVAKLSLTGTNDTLCSKDKPVKIAPIEFRKPIFNVAVYPKTKADLDKLGVSLSRLAEEEPTITVQRDTETGETILSGIGETQLEVAAEKVARKFGVNIELKVPKVPYRETITAPAKAEYKHKKQTGGHGQYGHVMLELEPMERSTGHEFVDKVVGGRIPRNYIPAVEKGVNEAVLEGVLARYPVTDIRVIVYDGSFHPVDSSEICFKIAGAGAVKKGLSEAHPVLLEPIVNITVRVPEDYTGDIIGDLNTKRAQVQGMNPENGTNVIQAQVPLAEVLRYAIDLKSITQGRGDFEIEFSHYQEAPQHIIQKVIAEKQAEKA